MTFLLCSLTSCTVSSYVPLPPVQCPHMFPHLLLYSVPICSLTSSCTVSSYVPLTSSCTVSSYVPLTSSCTVSPYVPSPPPVQCPHMFPSPPPVQCPHMAPHLLLYNVLVWPPTSCTVSSMGTLRELAKTKVHYVPTLKMVLAYLEVSSKQEYVVQRIKGGR